MKKIIKLVLVFVLMLMPFLPSVNAEKVSNYDNSKTTGTINITKTISGKTYNVYQILVLDSYDSDSKGYIYKIDTTSPWAAFIKSAAVDGVYLNVDAENYVTEVKGADFAGLAKLALEYAEENDIDPTYTKTATGTETVFENVKLGYYLVDSSLGAICGLTSAKPVANIWEKNSEPTVVKDVKENSTNDYSKDKTNTASIGDKVEYKTTITAGLGAENYILYDVMDEGLTFNDDVVVKLGTTTLDEGNDYVFLEGEEYKDYTFVISIKKALALDDIVTVEYSATINQKAVNGSTGNKNDTWLQYGNKHYTDHDTTTTYTYSFDLVKTDGADKLLDGAEFELYDAAGNQVFVVLKDGVYYVDSTITDADDADVIVAKDGQAIVKGLDSEIYYLKETRNPDGYTKLLGNQKVDMTKGNLVAEIDGDTYVNGGVRIVNEKGESLPETGGIGTVMFIAVGSLMVIVFGLLLVSKFIMTKMEN